MRKSLALPALAALALSGPVLAAEDTFSYTMIEGGFTSDRIDDPDGDDDLKGSGFTIGGSVALSSNVFGFASLSGTEYDYTHLSDAYDFSLGKVQLGVGINIPLSSKLDLVTGVSLQRLRLEDEFDDALNEEGYGVNLGLRGLIGQRLQWTAGVNYVDYGHDVDDTSWTAGLRYYFTRGFAMGVDIGSTDKDQGNALIAFRWDIGNR